jgi:hypothetical protein
MSSSTPAWLPSPRRRSRLLSDIVKKNGSGDDYRVYKILTGSGKVHVTGASEMAPISGDRINDLRPAEFEAGNSSR